jgi:hypothetical protein
MQNKRLVFAAMGILTGCQTIGLQQGPPTNMPSTLPAKNYASPNAVFDVYRNAIAKRDTRAEMLCLTAEMRADLAFHTLAGCADVESPQIDAVLRKHNANQGIIDAEYYKEYQAKHGVDLRKQQAEYEARLAKAWEEYDRKQGKQSSGGPVPSAVLQQAGPPPPPPLSDERLIRKIVDEKIINKVEFVVDVRNALQRSENEVLHYSVLKNVSVQGDTAFGMTTVSIHDYGGAGKAGKNVIDTVEYTFDFRKTSDGWLISSLGAAR